MVLLPPTASAIAPCTSRWLQLGWLGAPYDTYLFSDFASVDPARYRAALFLSPAGFSEAQLRRLTDWKREGRSLLFSGYPGYAAGKLGEACEIACEIGADTAPLRAAYRGEAYPSQPCSGPQVALLPGDGDVVLAREENGAAAAVLHRKPGIPDPLERCAAVARRHGARSPAARGRATSTCIPATPYPRRAIWCASTPARAA